MEALRKRKRERTYRSLFRLNCAKCGGLASQVCGDNHEFGLVGVPGKAHFGLADTEFTAFGAPFAPNLIEEILIAHALENKLGRGRGLAARAGVGKGDAVFRLVSVPDQNGYAGIADGCDDVVARRIGVVANDEVERDAGCHIGRLGVRRSRRKQKRSERKENRAQVFHKASFCVGRSEVAKVVSAVANWPRSAWLPFFFAPTCRRP